MKTISTEKALLAYKLLNTAKYNKLEDEDKIKIFKITRALKPIATAYEESSKDAVEKMKFEGFDEGLVKAQEYEKAKKAGSDTDSVADEEYKEFIKKLIDYDKLVKDAVKDLGKNENEVDIDFLTEDSFGKLMASNDWTMEQVMTVSDVVCS